MSEKFLAGLTDSDLYKFTMGCAVAKLYPRQVVRYHFFNRGNTSFPSGFADRLQSLVNEMVYMRLSPQEHTFLSENCGDFLDPVYLDFLNGYRYDPSEVKIRQVGGKLLIDLQGPWYRTIYWEVSLMALISELYFMNPDAKRARYKTETNPNYAYEIAYEKAKRLREADCKFADFGTRRRYSREIHEATIRGLIDGGQDCFIGTSNVWFANQLGVKCVGTHAHEWFSAHAAMFGYRSANRISLERWVEVYKGALGIALTDTFTTENFWKNFGLFHAKLFDGVRHDSGNPFEFGESVINHYEGLGIDPMSKTIIFSDGLNVDKAIAIQERFSDRIKIAFGIGTHFTNDIGPKAMNMVIKLIEVLINHRWVPSIKLSDDKGKHTGDKKEIDLAIGVLA